MDFSAYNNKFNAEEYDKSGNNGGDFPEIPEGKYPVTVREMRLKKSKAGNLMLSIQLKITDGNYKNQIIFYNQVIDKSMFGFKIAVSFVESLLSGSKFSIDKSNPYGSFDNFLTDVGSQIGGIVYQLDKSSQKSKKTDAVFDVYKIESVLKDNTSAEDSDIPF